MSLDDLVAGDAAFVDANIFTYHFQPHPTWGPSCTRLLQRIENRELDGFTTIAVLGEVVHRLMTIEAQITLAWSFAGIGNRLRSNPAEVQKLTVFRLAAEKVLQGRLQILPVTGATLARAVVLCQQLGLLTNDGLILATMQAHGLNKLASHDADFDRVPGITRYAPA
jgi:predicted nucleic acid-binding protein